MTHNGYDVDRSLLNFETYDDYITSFMKREDMRYINEQKIMKTLVKLGYRSEYEPYSEEEFQKRQQYTEQALQTKVRGSIVFGQYLKNKKDEFLNALEERELLNSQKKLSTIIFLTCRKPDGSEVLGYIDFEFSIRCASQRRKGAVNWKGVIEGRVKLMPQKTDLSYQNTHKHEVLCNDSDNYAVILNYYSGLMFKHKGDHKIIDIGPKSGSHEDNVERTVCFSDLYGYVALYDHIVRKKI